MDKSLILAIIAVVLLAIGFIEMRIREHRINFQKEIMRLHHIIHQMKIKVWGKDITEDSK